MRRLLWAACFLVLLAGGGPSAGEVPIPVAPVSWATDKAGLLSESARNSLDERLHQYEQNSGHQFLLYIDKTTGDTPLEDWCVKAFEAWGVGKKGKDDGVVLFVFTQDRKLRIEVGYGLEGQIPDALAWRIVDEVITPRLKAGDNDGAITAGVEAILATLEGRPADGAGAAIRGDVPPTPAPRAHVPLWQGILLALLGVGFLILLITHPSFALWLLFQILSAALSGSGGGGGGSRGGWSGGGGRSGGGGASGSW